MRWIYPILLRRWDGGAVKIAGTVSEGDEVAGFQVIHFPGHAPGLIGLWRESDRVAIVSTRGRGERPSSGLGGPGTTRRRSSRCAVWRHWSRRSSAPGTTGLWGGENLRETLERAAEKY